LSEHLVISIADCIFRKIIKTDNIVTGKKKKRPENYLDFCFWQERNSSKTQRFSESDTEVY
jgi:hypothetical protein